ncbi:MAG: tripartite tricarboxylate transporter substrate binding protein [Betaproteobacteria bacterium]|nr:tripartite tricarboxylate transporter substrate binding protein [Betaproteobacteria bacterium]MBI2224156.1 tripartite tricarboxylate transporter substrate binding protein [Betaproteobacteria bacterium]MBI3053509.1 tripartite tricarboxylate transporter substrate binding protein [Betaproteobacteria bacterium]
MMRPRHYRASLLFFALLCAMSRLAAQDYPVKPVRILVGFAAGSATDMAARMLVPRLNESLGQPVIVENRPGAGGVIAIEAIAKAPPDGYTLLMSAASITIQPAMRTKLTFDVLRDFSPVSLVVTGPYVLVVHPSVPARSTKDLVALARSKPGALNYASSGVGSSPHFAGELFNALAKVKTAHVPYKGSPEAALAVAKGEADFNFPSITGGRPLIEAGRVRPIAISTAKRTALMPDMPTLHESGVPGYDRSGWYGLIGPVGLPKDVLNKLNAAIAKGVNTPEMKTAFFKQGLEPETNTPEQFADLIRREVDQNEKLARAAGIAKE